MYGQPRGRQQLSYNPSHPLNFGRWGWWISLPGRMGGGLWSDVVKNAPATFTSVTAITPSYPGGWGSISSAGTSGYAAAPAILPPLPAATVFLSVNPNLGSNPNPYLCSKQTTNAFDFVFRIEIFSNLYLTLANGSTQSQVSIADPLTNNAWNRLAVTWNGTTTNFYVNGKNVGSASQASYSYQTTAALQIGNATNAGSGRGLVGNFDNFSLYPFALPASLIALDYQLEAQGYPGVLWQSQRLAVKGATVASPFNSYEDGLNTLLEHYW